MYEHLRNNDNDFTFPDNVILYCNPSEPSFGAPQGKESKLGDFFQLPQRLGWAFPENDEKPREPGLAGLNLDLKVQRWLYFEVLAQVFGHLPDYRWEDFVKADRSGIEYITTTHLPKYLQRWSVSESNSKASERKSRLIRIQQVLDKARLLVSQYCTDPNSGGDIIQWKVNPILSLSLMILGETLTRALGLIQRRLGFRIEGWCSHDAPSQGWGYSKLMLEKLEDDGWCAKAIHMLQALLRGNSIGLMYLFTLRSSSAKGRGHHNCTATVCDVMDKGNALGRSGPAPYHYCHSTTSDFCSEPGNYGAQVQKPPNCDTDGDTRRSIDGRDLADIINRGNIPLLSYRRVQRELKVVEMSQSFNKSYAIFSHVWTDGFGSLGSQNETSLCVLDMFSKMLEKVAVQRSGNKTAVTELFWIDTLTIPVEERYAKERREAIKQMHHIYTHAQYTIVLDLSLMRTTVGRGYSSPAMKITMCRWMTRLWTLQEAALSKNLFFCFSDRIFPMTQLEDMFPEEDSELHSCVPSLARTYYAGILGEVRPKIHEEIRKNERWTAQPDFLALVWKAAQWRSTAHPIHETLALATLLNHDTELFVSPAISKEGTPEYQQECDDRMIKLLTRFAAMSPCRIHPGMIFLPGPKLSDKGYRWAPRSWLSSHAIDSPDPLSLAYQWNTRLDVNNGLEVQLPGFLLHDLSFDREVLWIRKNIYFPSDSTLLEWYCVRPANDTPVFPMEPSLAGREVAIIVSRIPVVNLEEIALFVAVKEMSGGIRYVEILNRVWISREGNPKKVQHWSDKHREAHHEAMFAGERLPLTANWCVDGPDPRSIDKAPSDSHPFNEEGMKPLKRSKPIGFVQDFSRILRPFFRDGIRTLL
ncbi:MAG: hypothetical protein Q9182_002406 [Xanthomendoza sp. 2 TL-2023]